MRRIRKTMLFALFVLFSIVKMELELFHMLLISPQNIRVLKTPKKERMIQKKPVAALQNPRLLLKIYSYNFPLFFRIAYSNYLKFLKGKNVVKSRE